MMVTWRKFLSKNPVLIRLPRDLKRRAARDVFVFGSARARRRHLTILSWPSLAATWMGRMDSGLPEEKTAAGTSHLLLIHIQVPKVVESQPVAYVNQCLHVHQLSLVRPAVDSTSTSSSSSGSWYLVTWFLGCVTM